MRVLECVSEREREGERYEINDVCSRFSLSPFIVFKELWHFCTVLARSLISVDFFLHVNTRKKDSKNAAFRRGSCRF